MKLTSFASGSSGNCILVRSGDTNVLVDAGISMKRIRGCLVACGLCFDDLSGVFITHEHSDHVSGLTMLLKHTALRVFAPRSVASRLMGMFPGIEDRLSVIHTGEPTAVSGLSVRPFHTLHDTPESVGYRFEADCAVGVCTDLGCLTDEVREGLSGVKAALIEANHDEEMLRYGAYPVYLKRRILSEHGHLSNAAGGELAAELAEAGAEKIVLGHLSRENNTPAKAYGTVLELLESRGLAPELSVAPPDGILTVEVGAGC